jgi:MYXO-CTERM domain-containing protein
MRFTASMLAGSMALGALGCGAPPGAEKTRATRAPIQGGQSDAAHPFAVGLELSDGSLCSGTLIAPNLVLTARHCVASDTGGDVVDCSASFRAPVQPSQVFVTTDSVMSQSAKYIGVSSIEVPAEKGFCGNDIALLVLDALVPASVATPVTPVVEFSMTDRSKVGTSLVTMGYGVTGPARDDGGRRRIRRSVSVQCIPGDAQIDCSADATESPREFITQGFACEGDSGGGAFDQGSFDKGAPYVLGVLSRAYDSDTTCLDATYTRTDAFAKLIIDAAQKAADEGGYPYPAWTGLTNKSPDPAPAPDPSAPPAAGGGDAQRPAPPATPVTTTTTTAGCSTRGAAPTSGDLAIASVAVAALLARRRRRGA